jgi:DNA-binding transcriptional MerR regulator
MRVGELADRTDKTVRALHLYEERGLIEPVKRSGGGYRLYDESNVERIEFIDRLQRVGLSLAEIQTLVEAWKSGEDPRATMRKVEATFREQLVQVQAKIADLRSLQTDLSKSLEYLNGCSSCTHDGDTASACHYCVRTDRCEEEGPALIVGLTAH